MKSRRVALALKLDPLRFECEIDGGGSGILPLTPQQAVDLGSTLLVLGRYLQDRESVGQGTGKPADLGKGTIARIGGEMH